MNPITPRIVAIVGCGKAQEGKEGWAIGHYHAEGYRKADPSTRILGVDPNPENLAAFGERFEIPATDLFASAEALYENLTPDVVSICTWPALHAPQVIQAAERGVRAILCEKPLALNGVEISAMEKACAASGTLVAVAHQRCLNPEFRLAKKLLNEGVIGSEWVLEARVGDGWDILSWSVHWFDLTEWLFEDAPTSVLAGMSHSGQRRYRHAVEDGSVIFAEYPASRQAIFITGPENHQDEIAPVFIRGSEGLMAISNTVQVWNRKDGYRLNQPDTNEPGGFHGLALNIYAALEGKAPLECSIARCANATRTAFAAQESARLMRRIDAPFTTGYAPLEIVQHPPVPVTPVPRLALFADEHFGSGGREGILDALEQTMGNRPLLLEAASGLTHAHLEGIDALLIYHTQKEPDPETRAVLTEWITSGKPCLVVHAALGAYPEWAEFGAWAGKVWVWGTSTHPHEESQLITVDPRFAAWAEAWLPNDEVFIQLGETADVELLVEVSIPQGRFPAAWISRTHPNVATWVPGHRREMWSLPAMRTGLLEMLRLVMLQAEKRNG